MSDDLVKRAREMANKQSDLSPYDCYDDSDLLTELADRIEVLEAALARISNIKPHELGETPNDYRMRQIARASVAELKGHAQP